jgi:hypothetical protein
MIIACRDINFISYIYLSTCEAHVNFAGSFVSTPFKGLRSSLPKPLTAEDYSTGEVFKDLDDWLYFI